MRPPILLVHGAFGQAANFEPWRGYFRAAGYAASAISLPGHAPVDETVLRHLTLADCLAAVGEAAANFDRPPVVIPFLAFRAMVGMGLIMLAVSWLGNLLRLLGRLETTRWFLWATFLAFPTGFVATLAGWCTAEVGRQPWVVYGLVRTEDAVTPSLATGDVLLSLIGYVLVYGVFVSFGVYYIYKLLREGPSGDAQAIPGATGSRPMAFADSAVTATGGPVRSGG